MIQRINHRGKWKDTIKLQRTRKRHMTSASFCFVTGWLLPGPCTSNNRPLSLSIPNNVYRIIIQQEAFSVECQPSACRQYKLHNDQVSTCGGGGGRDRSLYSRIQIEQVWTCQEGRVDGRVLYRDPPVDRQTDMTDTITFANSLASGKYKKNWRCERSPHAGLWRWCCLEMMLRDVAKRCC